MRNPERLKDFLNILFEYDGKILTVDIVSKVVQLLIQNGLYRPVKVSQSARNKWNNRIKLSKAEVEKIFMDNPQNHKEAGFERGWVSRFDTWFKIAKELGFVWYFLQEKIVFSESGRMLLDKKT
jgi:hypothetical protein